ncbi:MAG: VCBS repeat-containing protein [Bacteroidales bacterium]|nr:VCBS repeat-containing protein [Bacteroidales bacterium]
MGGVTGLGTGVVGAIGGTVDIGSLGGATYTVPIEVPNGIAGMQPGLSIVYNSQSSNGLLGWGWTLGGLSAISRVNKTLFYDGVMDVANFCDDRFSMDGQRLVLVNNNDYGTNGAEYRTEVDGMSKIVSYTENGIVNGPAKFKVWTADGHIMEYGFSEKSRVIKPVTEDSTEYQVGLWLLNKVEDRDGNYIEYQYDIWQANYYVSKIKYTGNDGIGVTPCYTIVFDYNSGKRDDEEATFYGNYALHQSKLLESISVKWTDNEISRYDFGYYGINNSQGYSYNRLQSITYVKGGVAYNPTIIQWGTNDYGTAPAQLKTGIKTSPDNMAFFDHVKVTGDFNGDGLTDVITVHQQAGNKYANVYLNEGLVTENGTEKCSFVHHQTIELDSHAVSIQVADFDGDGRDDMVLVSRRDYVVISTFRIFPFLTKWLGNGWGLDYAEKGWNDENGFTIGRGHGSNLLIGDFLGRGKTEMMIQIPDGNLSSPHLLYITYSGNNRFDLTDEPCSVIPGDAFLAADFNGDGITEIWCNDSEFDKSLDGQLTEERAIASIYKMTSQSTATQFSNNHVYTSRHTLIPGDFNGDGHVDILSYEKVSSIPKRYAWKINYFKATKLYYPEFDITDALPINDPGDRSFDLFGSPSSHDDYQYIEVADMNGDGKSDVVIENEGYLYILYSPVVRDDQGNVTFSGQQVYSLNDIGLGNLTSTMTLCQGNFLGKENACILGNSNIFSPKPMTNRYSVYSIVDGMFNRTFLEYDYLTCLNSSIYSRSWEHDLPALDIYTTSLPIKAVKQITCLNPVAETPHAVTKYRYSDALIHKRGHGVLGFRKTTTTSYINGIRQDSTITIQSTENLEKHRTIAMQSQRVYNALDRRVTAVLIENSFIEKSGCPLVYVPLVMKKMALAFSPDDDQETMLSNSITENVYKVDLPSNDVGIGYYINTMKLTDTYEGVTDYRWAANATDCKRMTHTHTAFQPDLYLDNWIVNRPDTTIVISWQQDDNAVSRSMIVYCYRDNNSYHPWTITSYPGGNPNNANGLATSTKYDYDLAGNVIKETLSALSGTPSPRITTYEYDQYRFVTNEFNTLGYETQNRFNLKYGELTANIDCNGLATYYNRSDHLGSTDWVMYPDETFGCTAQRWARHEGSFYDTDAPEKSAYYTWKRISGELPAKVFYDAAGRELRTVTYSLFGDTIYRDTEYNNMGLKLRTSLPYFHGGAPLWTSYYYDGLLRPSDTYMPDGTRLHYEYDGLSTTTTFIATTGETRSSTEIGNYFGKKAKSIDDNGIEVRYTYYHNGMLKWTQIGDNANTRISMVYDDAGNRIRLLDPNYGEIVETYDAFGQLKTSTTPKGDVTSYLYDAIGRVDTRKELDNTHHTTAETNWEYYETNGMKGLLKQVSYGNDQTITYAYDANHLNRLTSKTERLFGTDYTTSYTYDDLDGFPLRVKTVTYPSGYTTENVYHAASGKLYRINDGLGNKLWETEDANAMGQITRYGLGANITSMRGYLPETGRLTSIFSYNNNAELQNLGYGYDDFGNLSYRYDKTRELREDFGYDNLDRLESIVLNSQIVSRITYDALGRMISKQADGHDVFAAAQYDYVGPDNQLRPHAISSATVTGNPFPNGQLDIDYTMFDKVKSICRTPFDINLDYGFDHQRIRMYDRSNYEKIYVGGCEFLSDASGSKVWTYLVGPMGVFGVAQTMGGLTKVHYVLKDHLGSWTTITNSAGIVEQERSFDAWGLMRNPNTWREYTGDFSVALMFDRGYTGHEHLLDVGLINMNGRVYDPVMSSFLSVDTYVQDPDNAQSFNRYAYCLNNPLKYTDPSGEFGILAAMAVGAAISMVSTMATNFVYDRPIYEGVAKAAVVGALQGAFSFGIGGAAGAISDPFDRAAFQMLAHGTTSGLASMASGGKFWQGFASGAVSSFVSSATAGICGLCKVPEGWTKAAMVAAGGLSGGVSSTMAGGDFWEGVCNGLICAGLNHAMHLACKAVEGPDDPPGKESPNINSKNKCINESTKQTITKMSETGGGIATALDGAAAKASMETLSIASKVLGGTFVVVSEIPDILTAWNDPSLGNVTKVVVGTGLGVVTVVAGPIVATGAFVLGVVNAFGGFDKGYVYLNNIKSNNN